MQILYITYIDFDEFDSASSIRPLKMYYAFKELGCEVKLLKGSQANKNRSCRKKKVLEIKEWLKKTKPDICYIESDTYPIMLRCDRQLLRSLVKMRIPVGYFYRDCYRKVRSHGFKNRHGLINCLKDIYLDILQWLTDRLLYQLNIIYFPSQLMSSMFDYKDMRILPPAGEIKNISCSREYQIVNTAIYVGGISERYGFYFMLEAFQYLNRGKNEYHLIIICRKNEIPLSTEEISSLPWLEIHQAFGDALKEYYEKASIALLPLLSGYNDFAVAVKLFEYMSYGLPVAAIETKEMAKIIREYHIGLVAKEDVKEYAKVIKALFESEDMRMEYGSNALKAMKDGNLWSHRAEQVIGELAQIANVT